MTAKETGEGPEIERALLLADDENENSISSGKSFNSNGWAKMVLAAAYREAVRERDDYREIYPRDVAYWKGLYEEALKKEREAYDMLGVHVHNAIKERAEKAEARVKELEASWERTQDNLGRVVEENERLRGEIADIKHLYVMSRAAAFEEAAGEASSSASAAHDLGQHVAANWCIDLSCAFRGKAKAIREGRS